MKNPIPVREMQHNNPESNATTREGVKPKGNKKLKKQMKSRNNNGKILLALLAGAGAGLAAGVLMAPESGEAMRDNLRKSVGKLGQDLDKNVKQILEKIEGINLAGLGGAKMRLEGDLTALKGKLRKKYAQLTEEDLTFAEGHADELVGNLQRALGKDRQEIETMLASL